MLLSAVSVLVVAQSSSEIPEGLMNNTVIYSSYVEYTCIRLCSYPSLNNGCTRKFKRLTFSQVSTAARHMFTCLTPAVLRVTGDSKGESEVHPGTGHEAPEGD